MERTLSINQIVAIIGMSNRWVRNRIKSGELPAIQPGRAFMVYESDLRDFLDSHLYRPDSEEASS